METGRRAYRKKPRVTHSPVKSRRAAASIPDLRFLESP
jgi:hypothetical protein